MPSTGAAAVPGYQLRLPSLEPQLGPVGPQQPLVSVVTPNEGEAGPSGDPNGDQHGGDGYPEASVLRRGRQAEGHEQGDADQQRTPQHPE